METFLASFLGSDIAFWVALATSLIGVFALVATRTPNKVDDKFAQFGMDLINFLGANLGKAKNADV